MIKYSLSVYDRDTKERITSVITTVDYLLDTINQLSQLGDVKGYILDDKESEDK